MAAARRLSKRAFREADQAFLVEGPQAVAAAFDDPRGLVRELFVTPEAADRHPELVARAPIAYLVTSEVLGALAQTVTPQGVVAVSRFCATPLNQVIGGPGLYVVLVAVRDPGNAGTLVRSADAFGADGVIFAESSVDPFNGKCVRASVGSLFHVPFAADVAVADAVAAVRAVGGQVLATAAGGATALPDLDLGRPTGWLFGNEAWGLPAAVAALADTTVRIPLAGRAESLNLAAAAAVCLYASAAARSR